VVNKLSQLKIAGTRCYFLIFFVVLGLLITSFNASSVNAQQFGARSITLSTPLPSAVATHNFSLFVPDTSITGSLVFEYCDNSAVFGTACNVPTGLNVSSALVSSQTGNTGFSVDNADTTANKLVLSRAPLASAVITSTYAFSNITNPSTAGSIVYVRIASYASNDSSGSYTDNGAVAFVVPIAFNVAAFVPPFLRLCVGLSVATDCSSASGDSLDLGDLSANHANAGQSQFSTGTNSPSGYGVYILGTTMTSGNDAISALASPTPSFPGNNQFGINLRANSNPPNGQDSDGVGIATPAANYNIPNQYTFNSGDSIASSLLPSDYNRMTVSYLANVSHNQNLGIYSTTLTYVAIAQF
jgi:hypothetical protein